MGLKPLVVFVALIFALTSLVEPRNGGGLFWDLGNAVGFLALAGLLFQMVPPARVRTGRQHEILGCWVLGIALVHAFWFLLGDGTVRFYLMPGAPPHMWMGLAGSLALATLVTLARMPDRMRVHRRYKTFRLLHRGMAGFTLAAALLHVVLSGFYLPRWPQVLLLVFLAGAASIGRPARLRPSEPAGGWQLAWLASAAVGIGGFVLIRNLGH